MKITCIATETANTSGHYSLNPNSWAKKRRLVLWISHDVFLANIVFMYSYLTVTLQGKFSTNSVYLTSALKTPSLLTLRTFTCYNSTVMWFTLPPFLAIKVALIYSRLFPYISWVLHFNPLNGPMNSGAGKKMWITQTVFVYYSPPTPSTCAKAKVSELHV